MKLFFAAILLAGATLCGHAQFTPDNVFIKCETNKSPLSYLPGEEMVYTFTVDLDGQSPEGLFLKWKMRNDDGGEAVGKSPVSQPVVVKAKLSKPGFVSVDLTLVDAGGKEVRQLRNYRNSKKLFPIGFYAGTAVQPEKLTDCGEPADFDAFWAKQKQRLAAVPFKDGVELTKVATKNNADIFAVSIPCAGPRPVTGFLNIPVNAGKKSLPAIINFFGYGVSVQQPPKGGNPRAITLSINAHGQKLLQDEAYYKDFFKSIRSNGFNYAFDPKQNSDPETAYFNGMALRVLRAMEYLKSRPEWDGKNFTARGGSQGGLQTMWAAALDPDVTVAEPSITWCCDMAGQEKKQRIKGVWYLKYVPALDYYDPVFMAKRIKNARVTITRAGLGDYTCPPSGLAVSYNNIASPRKSIRWVQGSKHSFIPKKSDEVVWSTEKK